MKEKSGWFPLIIGVFLFLSICYNIHLNNELNNTRGEAELNDVMATYWQHKYSELEDFHLKMIIENNEYWANEIARITGQ